VWERERHAPSSASVGRTGMNGPTGAEFSTGFGKFSQIRAFWGFTYYVARVKLRL
jgi:hypothetical protein